MGNASQGKPVVITCQPLTGLAFFWSTNITMNNLSFRRCGKLRSYACYQIHVAILFTGCSSIELSNLHVNESSGTGVAVYNAMDKVSIDSCQFTYGRGGGGLVIEASEATSQSFCTISNSTFTHNTASSVAAGQWIDPCGSTTRGGGISVVLRGEATNNTVQLVNSVRLNSNKAQFGGGLFVGFHDNASGNTVTVDNAEVTENEALVDTVSYTSGGGIFIGFNTKRFFGNTFAIYSSRIVSNEADIGGGISANIVCNNFMLQTDIDNLLIEKCTFDNNTAFQGTSAYLSQSGKCNQLPNITVKSSNFTNGQCSTVLRNGYILPCDGSLLVDSMPHVVFHGDITFARNSISALSLCSSSIELTSSARLQFISNRAYNGAGIQVNSSSIILNTGSSLLFKYNTASGQGGAIYADTCTIDQAGLEDCIFKHSNPSLHSDDWGVSISFIDNQQTTIYYDVRQTNAIYVDSVKSYNMFSNPSNSTFCWKGWSYSSYEDDDDCTSELSSGPAYFIYTGPLNYTVSSGDYLTDIIQNHLTVYDIWGIDITDPDKIIVEIISGYAYMYGQPSTLSSNIRIDCYNFYHSSLLYVYPLQFSSVAITVHFDRCNKVRICEDCRSLGHYGACPFTYRDAELRCAQGRSGILCGKCNDSDGYAIAINDPELSCIKCNSSYYGVAIFLLLQLVPTLVLFILLAVLHINITDGGLSGFVMFSQMVTLQFPGLGYTSWIPTAYCFSPLTEISFTIIDLYHHYYLSIPLTVYSIWNLNFLNLDPVPFCIPPIDTAAEAILLEYITAACPLVFIVVTYTWIKWYNNGYRLVVYTTRPVHQLLARFWQKFKIQLSLIDTYAGLMLLSYMRFLATSVKLLKFTFVVEGIIHEYHYGEDCNYTVAFYYDANLRYFGWPHAVYGVLAILCLLVFVVTPTIVLLFYHLKCFQRCLTRYKLDGPGLHALVDAYQGCFKNSETDGSERRYFAGIYLLFRFFYVAVIVAPITGRLLLVTEICLSFVLAIMIILFRPYKQVFYSFTNFIFVFFLLLLSIFYYVLLIDGLTGFCIMFIPFLGLCLYITYRLLKPCCLQILCKNKTERNAVDEEPDQEQAPLIVPVTTVSVNDFVADSMYADRILNPSEYNEQ